MTLVTHAALVQRLKSQDYEAIAARMTATPQVIDIQHALLGIMSEGGELADAVKRHVAYGTELDIVNIMEESGDLLWYIQLLLTASGYTVAKALDINEAKLIKRYGSEFSKDAAINRDTDAERVILEEAAPSNEREGWTINTGSSEVCPVMKGTYIDVEHRDGEVFYKARAGFGCSYSWKHLETKGDAANGDIVYWRLAAKKNA